MAIVIDDYKNLKELLKDDSIHSFKIHSRLAMLEALRAVVDYNGLCEIIISWKELLQCNIAKGKEDYWESPLLGFEAVTLDGAYNLGQLQCLWMILVVLFGEYGSSPRYGWIINREGCLNFLDLLLMKD